MEPMFLRPGDTKHTYNYDICWLLCTRAALLASKGYVTLALAYYGVDDLPPVYTTDGFDLEYFEQAIDFVLSLAEVSPKRLGLYGISLGGNLSLMMMSMFPDKVHACAVSSCNFVSAPGPTRYRGKVFVEGTNFAMDIEKSVVNSNDPMCLYGGLTELKK